MNNNALVLFHELMKKGWLDRGKNSSLWKYAEDDEVRDELDQMGKEFGFEIVQAQDCIYMVPTQDNDLFLKNNVDFRADIKATKEEKNRDLYLLNYLAIYIFFLFFRGEGNDAQVRDFMTKRELIKDFSDHCLKVRGEEIGERGRTDDYSENFHMLAEDWLNKKEGDVNSRKIDDRYGVVNKILLKFKADELFTTDDSGVIKPTKKTKDLMPYVLKRSDQDDKRLDRWSRQCLK